MCRSVLAGVTSRAKASTNTRIGLIVVAAFLIRADAAWQHSPYEWDERYHALVAKHLIEDPLTPALYRTPAVEYDYRHWYNNHIWLHKPPGALWLMAGSMRPLGVNQIAMRVPSVLLSTAAVFLTFMVGRSVWDVRVGLLAATFMP